MNCPKCMSEMEKMSFKEMRIDRCTSCKGLWFAPKVLAELRKDTFMADYILDDGKAKVGKQYDEVRDIRCPVCSTAMVKETDSEQRHISYESCPNGDGSFFDAGEFTDLVRKTFWDKFKPSKKV